MIVGTVVGGTEAGRSLASKAPRVRRTMSQSISRLTLLLVRRAKLKLSDDVLNVRSGRLRRSINPRFEGLGSPKPAGYVGTNVPYGRVHELGETVTVKQHLRLVRQAWGKELKFPVWATVPAHKVTYPERSFLRTALADLEPDIRKELANALPEALR